MQIEFEVMSLTLTGVVATAWMNPRFGIDADMPSRVQGSISHNI